MNNRFAFNPENFGLPTREELVELRIWDLHYHGINNHETVMKYVSRMGVERVFSLDIGRLWGNSPEAETISERDRQLLRENKDNLAGLIRIDPSRVEESLERMREWIQNGPAVGIKYANRNQEDINCSHPNNDPIIELADQLGALIYIHTWILVGGEPRTIDGGMKTGESTPMDVAELAKRFPDVTLICGHQGGDWEPGIRAIRAFENVFLEFSGGDPESGAVDFAVQEMGVDRLVWGGHLPSRSYANELSKVFDADLNHEERKKIFGSNLRQIAVPIMREKGYDV
ncbi:MAG: amidohydrolase family protein [Balneolaceae bacterium]|nr:amidohydrolase family protein [Balneolaceae bacterium]